MVIEKRFIMAKKRKAVKRHKSAKSYNAQMGTLSGREVRAKKREDDLVRQYQHNGMSADAAQRRARDEMRNNPTRDWRK